MLKSAVKIFIPENNLGNESSTLWHQVRKRKDLRCYSEKIDKIGVRKGAETADDFQYIINVKMRNNAIHFDNDLYTCSKGHTSQSIKGLFREQLERYHIEYDEKREKQKITGKGGSGENDDMVIVLGMCLMHGWNVLKNPRLLN